MKQILDNATFGALGMGYFLDVNGDKHEAMWSINDGSLIRDFGADSEIQDAKVFGLSTILAINDPIRGSYFYNFENDVETFLASKLGTTSNVKFTEGALFETTVNGETVMGASYRLEDGSLKASLFSLVTPMYDLSGDITASNVPLPYSTSLVFHQVGPGFARVDVTDAAQTVTNIAKPVVVASSGLSGTTLRLGGSDSRDDVMTLTATPSGYQVTDSVGSVTYPATVNQVLANFGSGSDTFVLVGDQTFDLGNATAVETLDLGGPGAVKLIGITRAAVVNASGPVGGLIIKAEPSDIVSFASEWSIAAKAVVKGVTVHVLVANGVTVYLDNDLATNPLNSRDVSGNNVVSPLDALLVINYLNMNDRSIRVDINSGFSFLDVNGDHFVSPLDALLVINWLNGYRGSGEGEAPAHQVSTDIVFQEMGNVDFSELPNRKKTLGFATGESKNGLATLMYT